MQHISNIEDFFSSFASSEIPFPDDFSSLLECFQGVWQGFYAEVLEINEGVFFVLALHAHESTDWNIMSEHPSGIPSTGATYYRFETLGAALEALAAFQRVTVAV